MGDGFVIYNLYINTVPIVGEKTIPKCRLGYVKYLCFTLSTNPLTFIY